MGFGISYQDVEQAAERLLQQGKSPTIEGIRAALGGTGSFGTISKHLNTWRSERLMIAIKEEPQRITPPDEINQAVSQVWEQLKTQSIEKIELIQKESEETIKVLEEEKDNLIKINEEINSDLGNAKVKINHLETDLNLIQKEYAEEKRLREHTEIQLKHEKELFDKIQNEKDNQLNELRNWKSAYTQEKKEELNQLQTKFKSIMSELQISTENQRTDFLVKIDALQTAKDKIEKIAFNTERELRDQQAQNKLLNEQKIKLEIDAKMSQQQFREMEKQLVEINLLLNLKEKQIENIKEENRVYQKRWEITLNKISDVKIENERLKTLNNELSNRKKKVST